MTIRFTTSRAIGAAIALTISAGALSAQTPTTTPSTTPSTPSTTTGSPTTADTTRAGTTSTTGTSGSMGTMGTMQDSTRRSWSGSSSSGSSSATRVRKDGATGSSSSGMQVRKETSSGEVQPSTTTTPAPAAPAPAPMPAPAPAVDSSSMMRDSSSMSSMSSSSTTTTTTTSTTVSTGETLPPAAPVTRFGNGLYFAVQGGANFPQNQINDYYKTGYGAGAQIGWDPTNSPLGLRVNGMWNRLNGKDLLNQTVNGVRYNATLPNADLYSVFGDAKLRLPFGRFLGATSGLYAVGGAGVTYFRNYNNFQNTTGINVANNSVVNAFNTEDKTQFALNGGGGLSFGVGAVSLFVEGRYVRVFTEGARTDYVPVTLGVSFH